MISVRPQAGQFPLTLPQLLILSTASFLFLLQVSNGQPNYYFKASAPAVKSLPRIGRRSEDGGGNGNDAPSGSIPFSKSFEFPTAYLDMWNNNLGGGGSGSTGDPFIGTSSRISSSLIPPLTSTSLEKSFLWRRLLGDINNYEEALLDNMYRPKN